MDELISALSDVQTIDPDQELDELINNYNTPFDKNSISKFLSDCKKRYKTYLYNINFNEFPELEGNIIAFVDSFMENKSYRENELLILFQMTKVIDKTILDIIS
jgi:hypothetical protein